MPYGGYDDQGKRKDRISSVRTNPQHVAIIMDGNGRWAKKRVGLSLWSSSRARDGATYSQAAPNYGIKYLTLYAFSTENWRRPRLEVEGLLLCFKNM